MGKLKDWCDIRGVSQDGPIKVRGLHHVIYGGS